MVVHAIYGSKPHFKEFIQRYNWLWKHIVDFVGNLVHNFGNGLTCLFEKQTKKKLSLKTQVQVFTTI